jgi:hypothetical protein
MKRVPLGEPIPFFPKIPSPVVDASATHASVRSSRIIPKNAKYFRTIPSSSPLGKSLHGRKVPDSPTCLRPPPGRRAARAGGEEHEQRLAPARESGGRGVTAGPRQRVRSLRRAAGAPSSVGRGHRGARGSIRNASSPRRFRAGALSKPRQRVQPSHVRRAGETRARAAKSTSNAGEEHVRGSLAPRAVVAGPLPRATSLVSLRFVEHQQSAACGQVRERSLSTA